MATQKKLQVFVSSTYRDLRQERQAAVEAILKAGHIPAGMELFSAGSESQLETIRRWIDDSDVYMLILGARYGSVDPKTSLSYTELEYDYAISKDKPIFAVVITDSAIDAKIKTEGKDVIETDYPKELKFFREKVLTRISSFFSDEKDIKLAVHETMADYARRLDFTGWVSGNEIAYATSALEELTRLRQEKEALLAEIERLRSTATKSINKPVTKWSDEELHDAIEMLSGIMVSTKVFSKDEAKPAGSYSVLGLFTAFRDDLITGVSNKYGASEIDAFIYYNVCPKLEIYDLAALEKVAGVQWQRYRLTAKGKALLAYLDKHKAKSKSVASASSDEDPAAKGAVPVKSAKKVSSRKKQDGKS